MKVINSIRNYVLQVDSVADMTMQLINVRTSGKGIMTATPQLAVTDMISEIEEIDMDIDVYEDSEFSEKDEGEEIKEDEEHKTPENMLEKVESAESLQIIEEVTEHGQSELTDVRASDGLKRYYEETKPEVQQSSSESGNVTDEAIVMEDVICEGTKMPLSREE